MATFRCVVVVAALASLTACTGGPRNDAAALVGREASAVLVLPLNVSVPLATELESSSDRVWRELLAYLDSHGKRHPTIPFPEARRLWLRTAQRISSPEWEGERSFDHAARLLVLELAHSEAFDAVLMPSLFLQTARMSARSAYWDGVRRRIEIMKDVHRIGSITTSTSLSGAIPAASLHTVVLDASGNKLHEGQGGLELLVRIRVQGKEGDVARKRTWTFEPRPDLFGNRDHVWEGIGKALGSFLPRISPAD